MYHVIIIIINFEEDIIIIINCEEDINRSFLELRLDLNSPELELELELKCPELELELELKLIANSGIGIDHRAAQNPVARRCAGSVVCITV